MSQAQKEAIVILHRDCQAAVSAVAPVQVVHVISRRLAIVQASAQALVALSARPEVERVVAGPDAAPTLDGLALSESEALFVQAWLLRQAGTHKQRPGEGVAWDELPGGEPPDEH